MTTIELKSAKGSPEIVSTENVIAISAMASLENGSLGDGIDHDPWVEGSQNDNVIVVDFSEEGMVSRVLQKIGLGRGEGIRGLSELEEGEVDQLREVIDEAEGLFRKGLIIGINEEDFERASEELSKRAA